MKEKRQKKKNKSLKAISTIFIIVMLLLGVLLVVETCYLGKIKSVKLNESDISISSIPKTIENDEGKEISRNEVTNILLLGVDNQEDASDSIIVISLDDTKKQIKMSSLLRDTYVFYGDDKVNKLNYAYHYGSAVNSVKVVNEEFKLDIKDFVKIDFGGLANIIDTIGGVEVDIKHNEVSLLNSYVKSMSKAAEISYTPISKSGKQILNGQQAVAYSRIRYVGNYDYERTERQRRVLNAVFDKIKNTPITKYPDLVSKLAPYLETSLSNTEMLSLCSKVMMYGKNGIKETRCPYDDLKTDSEIKGIFYLKWDKDKNIDKLHKFIYTQ
ncbi:transcriptional attenuator, LytR family [Clostridium amylolyticum]|uniref:Transcriptional attenuator, LytR family n=1 Tax=Clostridium amylolyticum TaxID=1121298 RepID=A0A1M6GYJ9_9CLOT|nr:LCP family protein [Clostridium amylolyticum]SHJ15029.1 transcriptional attenuator, LytR family [Clostridium amylolyticum]